MAEYFKLRPHHVLNLLLGYDDNYQGLSDGLRTTTLGKASGEGTTYTPQDAEMTRQFYSRISSNPLNIIEVIPGIDERCRLCSNYAGEVCAVFPVSGLAYEDWRSMKELRLPYGSRVSVETLLKRNGKTPKTLMRSSSCSV